MTRGGALAAALLLLLCGCDEGPEPGAGAGASAAADTGVLARIGQPVENGGVHLVRLVSRGGEFAFDPAEVRVRPGDVVRFVLAHPHPESVAFDTAAVDPVARRYLVANELLRGTLLTAPGQVYDVRLLDAPPGRYPFFSIPHASDGMRGALVVQ